MKTESSVSSPQTASGLRALISCSNFNTASMGLPGIDPPEPQSGATEPVSALANDISVELRAGSQFPCLSRRIKFNQSEAQVPAFVPLEVIGQAPVEVAAQVHASCQELFHLLDR